jgi:hypothetical protein
LSCALCLSTPSLWTALPRPHLVPDPRSAPARYPPRASVHRRNAHLSQVACLACPGCQAEVHRIHTKTSPSLPLLGSSSHTHTHTPGSSCPLPSTPAGACGWCAALPLFPDPPSPPPAPSRCLLPVLAISLFCSGCVDALQKPPTAPSSPQAVSPRSQDHRPHPLAASMDGSAACSGVPLSARETSGAAPASRAVEVPMLSSSTTGLSYRKTAAHSRHKDQSKHRKIAMTIVVLQQHCFFIPSRMHKHPCRVQG